MAKKEQKIKEKTMEETIAELMSKEDIKDVFFRYAVLGTEVGDLGKYCTHDQILNPSARPHGSKEDEKLAYGQVIVQLMALAYLRNINYEEALDFGLKNWIDRDWAKRQNQNLEKTEGLLHGMVACPGFMRGRAYIINSYKDLLKLKDSGIPSIAVMNYSKSNMVVAFEYITGIVTNHGGKTSHAASNAREFGKPCIVGTGNATEIIKQGDFIELDADVSGKNYIKILERAK